MDVNESYNKRNLALRGLRFGRQIENYYYALKYDEELIQAVASKRKNPPAPLQEFIYDQIAYKLQSWKNGTALYVRKGLWKEGEYEYLPPDKMQKVRDELSISAQINFELEILKQFFPDEDIL